MRYQAIACLLAGLLFWGLGAGQSVASPVTYYFSGTITNFGANECDVVACTPSLVGPGAAAIGMEFSGEYTFDETWAQIYSDINQANYVAPAGSDPATFPTRMSLGGIDYSFAPGVLEIVPQNHYGAGSKEADGANSWNIVLYSAGVWGDGTTNIPSTIPILSNFDLSTSQFFLYLSEQPNGGLSLGNRYFGQFAYFGETPCTGNCAVSSVPIPAALPLFAAGLTAMGFLGWRRKQKAAAASHHDAWCSLSEFC